MSQSTNHARRIVVMLLIVAAVVIGLSLLIAACSGEPEPPVTPEVTVPQEEVTVEEEPAPPLPNTGGIEL